jgi:hypothetical protein
MNKGKKSLSIIETYIVEPNSGIDVYSACTGFYTNTVISCSGDSKITLGNYIEINKDLLPEESNILRIGTLQRRFREVNSVSGQTIWFKVENRLETPEINLGKDIENNDRIITAETSILRNDILIGGTF